MKRLMLFISIIAIAAFITACGDNDNANDNNASNDVTNNGEQSTDTNADNDSSSNNANATDDSATNQNDSNTGENNANADSADAMQAKMDELDYAEIEVEVDYGEDNEYEIEMEQDEGKPIEAEMEDEVNGEFLKGEEAFNKLYPMVKELSIDKDTDKETAIKDVLDTFDLDEDYDEFELEITFNDGNKLEYEDK